MASAVGRDTSARVNTSDDELWVSNFNSALAIFNNADACVGTVINNFPLSSGASVSGSGNNALTIGDSAATINYAEVNGANIAATVFET